MRTNILHPGRETEKWVSTEYCRSVFMGARSAHSHTAGGTCVAIRHAVLVSVSGFGILFVFIPRVGNWEEGGRSITLDQSSACTT
jgi:hypothetical protein